jgi:hypothetical protein
MHLPSEIGVGSAPSRLHNISKHRNLDPNQSADTAEDIGINSDLVDHLAAML